MEISPQNISHETTEFLVISDVKNCFSVSADVIVTLISLKNTGSITYDINKNDAVGNIVSVVLIKIPLIFQLTITFISI